MALGIRGANPIWSEVDLQGNLFDDTFYLFVLENTIPYIPAVVYHDPDLNLPWTNPIQFLGNGTLPTDIYFESDVVYRLEFRQGPTQADPLIYEIDNYIAGTGGSTPVDTVAFASSNQITNPQFALINFSSPLTISGTNPSPIEIGPGWFLELAGTGTVTITRVALNSTNPNPSNAPYALQLTLSGWNADGVFLRQRFQQNGMLWANKIVSSTLTARVQGTSVSVSANLIDSNGTTLAQVLDVPTVNGSFNEFTGYGELPASTNTNTPPAAYIDYKLGLPSSVDIYLTSLQLVVQELPIEPSFEQDSIDRQIDHTYHYAYPIVPVGTVIDFFGFVTPAHYTRCQGQALSRQEFQELFSAITFLDTVTWATVTTFTVTSSQNYWIGMVVEGPSIPASTTITNIVGTTITISNNRTGTNPSVRFFAAGAGDGSTTFNVPDLRDYVTACYAGSLFGSGNNGIGKKGGAASHSITIAEMPAHDHPGSSGTYQVGSGGGGAIPTASNLSPIGTQPVTVTVASQGGGSAMSLVQQTVLVSKIIRFE